MDIIFVIEKEIEKRNWKYCFISPKMVLRLMAQLHFNFKSGCLFSEKFIRCCKNVFVVAKRLYIIRFCKKAYSNWLRKSIKDTACRKEALHNYPTIQSLRFWDCRVIVKATVSGVLEYLTFKISEVSDQNWSPQIL